MDAKYLNSSVEAFRRVRPAYESYATKLQNLVRELLKEGGVDVIQTESRAKTLDSFTEKIRRKEKMYEDPLVDVTDLCGLRVIVYYIEDLKLVRELLFREFLVDVAASTDKSASLNPDQFGYLSNHYVIRLGPTRSRLVEWKPFATFAAELQVRTVLQHAWAAVSHKLNYKSSRDVPVELQRRLSRLSALFEIADEQFSVLRTERASVDRRYAEAIAENNFELAVDAASIEAYLDDQDFESRIVQVVGPDWEWINLVFVTNPPQPEEDRHDLLKIIDSVGISTIKELHEILDRQGNLASDLVLLDKEMTKVDIIAVSVDDVVGALILLRTKNFPENPVLGCSSEYWATLKTARRERAATK
jgi:ppGpp synthetase/RelA/SpoT-type nucleotidyltranferase